MGEWKWDEGYGLGGEVVLEGEWRNEGEYEWEGLSGMVERCAGRGSAAVRCGFYFGGADVSDVLSVWMGDEGWYK